ncbi:hypothetical protein OTU49_008926, partial [Cherax quadricarinatus]
RREGVEAPLAAPTLQSRTSSDPRRQCIYLPPSLQHQPFFDFSTAPSPSLRVQSSVIPLLYNLSPKSPLPLRGVLNRTLLLRVHHLHFGLRQIHRVFPSIRICS